MKFCRMIFSVLAFAIAAMLVACSGGSTNNNGGGNNPISVALSGTVPTSLAASATASLTATVSNDSAGKGVSWSCAPSGSCGSFNPTGTASAAATTYTAPAAVPSGGSVTVTATSVADGTKSATATITITGPNLSAGNYVFSVSGSDASPALYSVAGVFTVDSNGQITGGEQDFSGCCNHATDLINPTGSTLSTTASGNLQITLTTCNGTDCTTADTTVGVAGVETFAASMMSSATSGRIIEFDAAASSSGTIDQQTSTSAPTGGYAFAVHGANSSSLPLAIGGVINISGTSVSTASSAFDLNFDGTSYTDQTFSAGSVSAPDASGRVVLSLTPSNTSLPQGIAFAGYIVDAAHIRLAELTDPLGSGTGGTALGQNAAGLSVAGNSYVLGMTGYDVNGALQAAGVFTLASGATTVSGNISYSDLAGGGIASPLSGGSYVADTIVPGRVTMTGVTDGNINLNLQLYVDGNGNALAITLDTTDVLGGTGYLQTGGGTFTAASFSGTYVMDATGVDSVNELELDAVGPISADGSANLSATVFDLNSLAVGAPTSNVGVTGTFTASSDGVFNPGSLTGLDVTTSSSADTFVYYLVDPTKVIAIETDSNQLTLAFLGQ